MKRILRCSGIVILVAVVLVVVVTVLAPETEPATSPTSAPAAPPTQAPEAAPVEYPIERGGSLSVPGGIAYMDGSDAEADPPLTVMNIQVYEGPIDNRGKSVCQVRHGDQVTVTDANLFEGRLDFKIQKNGCSGWVWELFLSTEYNEPIGEQMEAP